MKLNAPSQNVASDFASPPGFSKSTAITLLLAGEKFKKQAHRIRKQSSPLGHNNLTGNSPNIKLGPYNSGEQNNISKVGASTNASSIYGFNYHSHLASGGIAVP